MDKDSGQLKIGVLLSYLNIGLGNLIPIFYTPVMLAILGQNEYGLYKLSSSVTSYLSLISMGIGSAVTRYLIKAYTEEGKEAEERVLGLFMVIFQIIAILTFVVGLGLTINLNVWYGEALNHLELSRMKILVFLMVCNTALGFSISPYMSIVTAHERFIFYQCMSIMATCATPIANLIMLLLGYKSIGMAVSTLIVNIVIRLIYLSYVRRNMGIRAKYKDMPKNLIREILLFSFWVFVSNVVGQLYNATDTVMIGAVPKLATKGVAVYSIGITFNSIIGGMTTSLSSLMTPIANKMVFSGCSNDELTAVATKVGRIQGLIFMLAMSGFVAFGKPFISFYAGQEYKDAYWITIITTLPCIVYIVQSVFLSVVIAKNKHKFRSIVYLGIAIVNVIGTWFLMNTKLGIIGAALMTGIATLIGQGVVMNWYYAYNIGLDIKFFWKELSIIVLWPWSLCAVVWLTRIWLDYYNIGILIFGIFAYTVLYTLIAWLFVLNDYEKNLIKRIIPCKRS